MGATIIDVKTKYVSRYARYRHANTKLNLFRRLRVRYKYKNNLLKSNTALNKSTHFARSMRFPWVSRRPEVEAAHLRKANHFWQVTDMDPVFAHVAYLWENLWCNTQAGL